MTLMRRRIRGAPVSCALCGTPTAKVHAYRRRTVADLPVDGRRVHVRVCVRRLVCQVVWCPRQTFREQIPRLLERHQHRTVRLTGQISEVARELCGRAAARPARVLAALVSRSRRSLVQLSVPEMPRRCPTEQLPLVGTHGE